MSSYADTSFLASLYALDSNSELAAKRMRRAGLPLFITPFGELELTNALALRLFRKELSAADVKAANALIVQDFQAGILLPSALSTTVFTRAKQLAQLQTPRLGTRTLDVLHVASASLLRADAFYTLDERQKSLAAKVGLRVF